MNEDGVHQFNPRLRQPMYSDRFSNFPAPAPRLPNMDNGGLSRFPRHCLNSNRMQNPGSCHQQQPSTSFFDRSNSTHSFDPHQRPPHPFAGEFSPHPHPHPSDEGNINRNCIPVSNVSLPPPNTTPMCAVPPRPFFPGLLVGGPVFPENAPILSPSNFHQNVPNRFPPPPHNLGNFPMTFQGHPNLSLPPPSMPPVGSHPIPPTDQATPGYPYPFPPALPNNLSLSATNEIVSEMNVTDPKEVALRSFLSKFQNKRIDNKIKNVKVVEFRSVLRQGLTLSKELSLRKSNLSTLLQSEEVVWQTETNKVTELQNQLTEICGLVSAPHVLNLVKKKIKTIEKKRQRKKKQKLELQQNKAEKELKREALHHEIDKWLDAIKEKNVKLKREAEMKKEADFILSEVRKKIHEANKTIEKLKVFEKLRDTREKNMTRKGQVFLPEHAENFESGLLHLKEMMLTQLADYEAEQRALEVMLEVEREDHREEEWRWRMKKISSLQERRKNNILQCLFSRSEEPAPGDPLHLFYMFHNAGNSSIESLMQIRHIWDHHLNESGEPVPSQWVVPAPPCSKVWEEACGS